MMHFQKCNNPLLQVLDVGHFWGFPGDEASLEKQRLLTGEINKCTLNPVEVSLYPNLLCLAPYSESSEQSLYYRAKILHMRGNTVEVNVLLSRCNNLSYLLSFFFSTGNSSFSQRMADSL